LPLYDWPFESGFPTPSVAVASAQAAVASGLSIEASAALADAALAAPLAMTTTPSDAIESAALPAAAVTSPATADAVVNDLGDDDPIDALFADAILEHELEELAV
jgi:hypothetical protein